MNKYNLLNENLSNKVLKSLTYKELLALSVEIRDRIIMTVSNTGGHLSSNLGVVELTLALHRVFDLEKDQIVFDVSHQSYTHKILTGRNKDFDTLRSFGGISGFSKISESKYDAFGAGHASTSISAALGLKIAKEAKGDDSKVIALIGDGAMTGGLAFEALNHVGHSKKDLIIILNDNMMSISENVGAMSKILSRLRISKTYLDLKKNTKGQLEKIPKGKFISSTLSKAKSLVKQAFVENMFFEDLGLNYIGLVDGHNIKELEETLIRAKNVKGPLVIHVITEKGRGYRPAKKYPDIYHGVGNFSVKEGLSNDTKGDNFSKVVGKKLIDLAKDDSDIVAITAAMRKGTGLEEFSKKFPNRFFDVGIAEAHGLCLAAGMARNNLKPYFAVYSTFLQRAYDQLIHDVCLQNLPVRILVDRCGLVGDDGPTHHGVFDMNVFLSIPNLKIISPATKPELELALDVSKNINSPLIIRYPKTTAPQTIFDTKPSLDIEIIGDGKDLSLVSFGYMSELAYKLYKELISKGISAKLIIYRVLKPFDEEEFIELVKNSKLLVSIEDSMKIGGFGSFLNSILSKNDLKSKFLSFAYEDEFITHGEISKLMEDANLSIEHMLTKIQSKL